MSKMKPCTFRELTARRVHEAEWKKWLRNRAADPEWFSVAFNDERRAAGRWEKHLRFADAKTLATRVASGESNQRAVRID